MSFLRTSTVAFSVVATLALVERDARADADLQFTTSLTGTWLRQSPVFSLDPTTTSARSVPGGGLASRAGIGFLGPAIGTDLTLDKHWTVPLFGLGLGWAAGSYDAHVESVDGSIARVEPWSAFRLDVFIPGVGYKGTFRRWSWAIALRPGLSYLKMDGSIAAGATTTSLNLGTGTFLLQGEIEGCRRLDPDTRVCLQLAPHIYEYQAFNGGSLSLRVEWGR